MIYKLECYNDNMASLSIDDAEIDSSHRVVEIRIEAGDQEAGILLNESSLYKLIGALHHVQKQIKTKK